MPTFVLDAGALIALERGDREVVSILKTALRQGYSLLVPAGVVGQVWRQPDRQVTLARTLRQCDEVPLDGAIARSSGRLCGQTGTSDVIDASVAVAVSDSSNHYGKVTLITSDPDDMSNLLAALRADAAIIKV